MRHCRQCQRQNGSAFAVNALIETDRVALLSGSIAEIIMTTPSGKGQTIARCPKCMVAVWSHYDMGGLGNSICFIRVGSLDQPDLLPPDVHIFTSTRLPWVVLPPGVQATTAFYRFAETWSQDSLRRRDALFEAAGIDRPAKRTHSK